MSKLKAKLKSKLSFAAIAFVIGFSGSAFFGSVFFGPALAQTADPRGACKTDYDKYCGGVAPGGGRVVACLSKQRAQLSDACKRALDSRKKQ
jgi:hypothetical protein